MLRKKLMKCGGIQLKGAMKFDVLFRGASGSICLSGKLQNLEAPLNRVIFLRKKEPQQHKFVLKAEKLHGMCSLRQLRSFSNKTTFGKRCSSPNRAGVSNNRTN
jgi:hypothetical protein